MVGIHIQHGDDGSVRCDDRDHHLAVGRTAACDVLWAGMDIRDILCTARGCRRAADPAIEGDVEAAMATLVWPDFQVVRPYRSVESRPMEVVEGMVQFTDHGCHGRHPIALTFEQCIDPRPDLTPCRHIGFALRQDLDRLALHHAGALMPVRMSVRPSPDLNQKPCASDTASCIMAGTDVLAGAGGMFLGAARTDHVGRRAIMLVRGGDDPSEMLALAVTMGIEVVDSVRQSGAVDPRTVLGRGRIDEVADVLQNMPEDDPWYGVDLVLLHVNATPRQLVATSTVLGVEVWDRVRLLLSLFTAHASSVEARMQVRIARLRSDRTVLRELISQETTGERAGYGGAGATGAGEVLAALGREVEGLRRRLARHARAQAERRRQRTRGGARTVGLAGYTNAGKSSLFRALSGKEVLVEDRLFSTLETTVGRMEASPRILLADTIGFIDALPSETLEAFRATLAEALECDLLLLVADASDPPAELHRRITTSLREVRERLDVEVLIVLSKADRCDQDQRRAAIEIVQDLGLPHPHLVSSHSEEGMDGLRNAVLTHLHGPAIELRLVNGDDPATPALEAALRDVAMVEGRREAGADVVLSVRMDHADLKRLMAVHGERIVRS